MIPRLRHAKAVADLLGRHPVVGLLGARQVGKTTLARRLTAARPAAWFDLEDPGDVVRLADPMLALRELRGLVVLDEIQRRPELFPVLRVLADRPRRPARFLVLGSASPELLRQSSESLAGRIAYHHLPPLDLREVGTEKAELLWSRGGFPAAFAAKSDAASLEWRRDFITTFLERDLAQFGVRVPALTMRRFWTMLAHYHGQLWSSSEFARSFGMADTTVRGYLDTLSSLFLVRQLPPWHENVGKRQVKAPKAYLSDSGLLHSLLGLHSRQSLESHPTVGASWEGFGLETVIRILGARAEECFFWRTHAGAELDLLVVRGGERLGFEFKRADAPALTPSMRTATADLKLDRLIVLHAGTRSYPLAPRVEAMPLAELGRSSKSALF